MEDSFIVRADFYPDGTIRPLGITDKHGITYYIDYVKKPVLILKNGLCFKCRIQNRDIDLLFHDNHWKVVKQE